MAKIDGPLQVDAAIALGKIGDKSSLATLAALQRSAPRESQPAIAAAICLLGVNCESHQPYLGDTLRFAIATIGFQELLRGVGRGPGVARRVGPRGGGRGADPAGRADARSCARRHRAGDRHRRVAQHAAHAEGARGARGCWSPAIDLLREAFDMLEEDFEEERFFVTCAAPTGRRRPDPGAAGRDTLIRKLEF